jgi:predicted deacylase
MRSKLTFITLWTRTRSLPQRYTIPLAIFIVYFSLYAIIFLIDKPVSLSYAGATCVKQLTLFPDTQKRVGSSDYIIRPSQQIKLGDTTIATGAMCFMPTQPPHVGVTKVSSSPFGGWLMSKTFAITVDAPPVVHAAILNKAVPASKSLAIPLSETDRIFTYHMRANNTEIECAPKEKATACDMGRLKLSQGTPYTVELTRQFNGKKVASIIEKKITTLSAVSAVSSSIQPGETIYAKPRSLDIVFDKKIAKIDPTLYRVEGSQRTLIPTTLVVSGEKVHLSVADDLQRSANYELTVDTVDANDGSGLETPYKLPFKTSGGPKVMSVSVGKTGVQLGSTAIITFDQPLSDKQDISKIVTVSEGVAAPVKRGAQLLITLANVPKCGDFSIKITNDLQNGYDIAGSSAWSYVGRTICHTLETIGYSAKGRAINAYYFGSGPAVVLYTGAIHGNEISTKYLMDKWVNDLEINARGIPANKTVVVVPQLNPDGVSSSSRVNARNVDLNRNFATSDWKKDITTVNNQSFPGGGGESAMSEPETQAVASLVQHLRPSLVMSYHSVGSVVAANQAGQSGALAGTYSQMSGYRNTTGQTSSTFEYAISGTADDWYAEKFGIPSILIELGSSTDPQFSRNQKAMWTMLNS